MTAMGCIKLNAALENWAGAAFCLQAYGFHDPHAMKLRRCNEENEKK